MSLIEIKKKLLMAQKKGLRVQDVFNTSLWTGTGAARTITTGIDSGEGSLVWIKIRDSGGLDHVLSDTVQGAGISLSTNLAAAQSSITGRVTSFGASTYSLGNNNLVNFSGYNYVGWQFRRAPKFFDIVQYTGNGVQGRQIAHNLGIKPGMIFVKRLDASAGWLVYHHSQGATKFAYLNTTDPFAVSAAAWASTEPTGAYFSLGNSPLNNASDGTYIAYLFAHDPAPEGFIQCGSYVGNGSATGPVVNLGWRPQYLMVKDATGGVGNWLLFDAARGMGVGNDQILTANNTSAEVAQEALESTSNGFQIKSTSSGINASGQTYIYMAIREAA